MVGVEERVKMFLDNWNDRIDDLKMKRMLQGERKHGPLNLEMDSRDFIQEGIEELIDFLNYLEWAMEKGELGFCEWVAVDVAIRDVLLKVYTQTWVYNLKGF